MSLFDILGIKVPKTKDPDQDSFNDYLRQQNLQDLQALREELKELRKTREEVLEEIRDLKWARDTGRLELDEANVNIGWAMGQLEEIDDRISDVRREMREKSKEF